MVGREAPQPACSNLVLNLCISGVSLQAEDNFCSVPVVLYHRRLYLFLSVAAIRVLLWLCATHHISQSQV